MSTIDDSAQFALFSLEDAAQDEPEACTEEGLSSSRNEVAAVSAADEPITLEPTIGRPIAAARTSAREPRPPRRIDDPGGAEAQVSGRAVSSPATGARYPRPLPQNLEEALQQVAALNLLTPEGLRHVRSDVTVAAAMIELPDVSVAPEGGHVPAAIPCDPEKLRPLLNNVRPMRSGRTPRRWSSIRSSITRLLRLTGWLDDAKADRSPLPQPWQAAGGQIDQAPRHAVFVRFARFCVARGVAPADVSTATLAEFRTYRLRSTLDPFVGNTIYALRRAWNDVVDKLPAWDGRRLGPLPRTGPTSRAFSELAPSFAADVDANLARLMNPDPFDRAIRKALSPTTINCLRSVMRHGASTLTSKGWAVADVSSVRDLMRPKAVEAILRDQWERVGHGKAWPAGASPIAAYLKMIARHCEGLSDDERAAVKELCDRVKNPNRGMTAKSRRRLAEFDDPAAMVRLVSLPDQCFAEADRLYDAGKQVRAAQLHQCALALAILICKPLRKLQLARLDLRYFRRNSMKRLDYFCIPGEETKNGQDNEATLPVPLVRRLAIHLQKYRPHLQPGEGTFLFVGRPRKQINDQYLARRLSGLVEDHVGADFSVHFARHLAATLLLDDDPNNGPVAQRLLDHTTVKTTIRYYGAIRTRASQQKYMRILEAKTSAPGSRERKPAKPGAQTTKRGSQK